MRLQAEFENFRRRSLKERQESLQYGHQNLVKDLLASVDNLERALAHSQEDASADMESVVQGVELVKRELLGALGKHGVKVIEPLGEAFDPAFHEAMGQLPDASVEPNSVLEVLQKGYMINDRMLRPARVLLAREPGENEEPVAPDDDGADNE
jgi:molecular chaperone GrpE